LVYRVSIFFMIWLLAEEYLLSSIQLTWKLGLQGDACWFKDCREAFKPVFACIIDDLMWFLWLDRYLVQWIYFNGTISSRRYQGAEYQFMKQTFMTTISGIGNLLIEYQFIKTHSWTQYWKLNLHENALVSM
jgi:hypothetical protein